MKYEIVYDIDYSALREIVDYIKNKLGETPHLIEAVQAGGDYIVQEWINTAGQKFNHSMGGYAQGIVSGVRYPFRSDPLRYLAENTSKYARALEDGFCVLYSPNANPRTQPKVFTENGWKPCTSIKIGDYVLNKDGKFTKVLLVHKNDLYKEIRLKIVKILGKRDYQSKGKRDWCLAQCPKCGNEIEDYKLNVIYKLCPKCRQDIKVVKIVLWGRKTIQLTADHPVLTSRGYKEAQHLKPSDRVALFFDNECKVCKKPVYSGYEYCSRKCAAEVNSPRMVVNGKHFTQQFPVEAKASYMNNLSKAIKKSGLEEAFYKYFSPYGYEIKRQYPVQIIKDGGKTGVYWLDFYLPMYKIGIELDGTTFHKKERDQIRDGYIKKQAGITIIRITDKEWRKNYKNCIRRVIRRISNHENLYKFEYRKVKSIDIFSPLNGFASTKKFDLTVEEGGSFICQTLVIHNSSFDMKKALLTSNKVRISKDGNRYLIIPFQHGTPGSTGLRAMPPEIYAAAKNLKHSAVLSTFKEGSIRGAKTQADAALLRSNNPDKVTRRGYQWGERLTKLNRQPLDEKNIYHGMVRFQNNPNINRETFNLGKFGGDTNSTDNFRNSSSYMTFRIMSERSSGWIHPGGKAMNILKETMERTRQPILLMLGQAAKEDMQKIGNFQ